MTIETTDRVRVGNNGYDGDTPQDPDSFQGKEGVVSEILTAHGRVVYYVLFDDPNLNERYGETPTSTWPFYLDELEKVRAST